MESRDKLKSFMSTVHAYIKFVLLHRFNKLNDEAFEHINTKIREKYYNSYSKLSKKVFDKVSYLNDPNRNKKDALKIISKFKQK